MRDKRQEGTPTLGAGRDPDDERRWDAVQEATELVVERRFDEALLELKAVLAADVRNSYAFHQLGNVLFELEKLEPARDAYKAAVLISPSFLGARLGLSHALRRLGDADGAEQEARAALKQFPHDGEAMHALGLALASSGKRAAARKSLEGFLATNPEFEAATEVRGILEMLGLGGEDEPLDVDD